jgi:hypothetical protein
MLLLAFNYLTTNSLPQLSAVNSWLTVHNQNQSQSSSKFLLALINTFVFGLGTCWDPWPYFCSLQTSTYFEMGPPFHREEGSDNCWLLPIYWGVTLLVLTLTDSLTHADSKIRFGWCHHYITFGTNHIENTASRNSSVCYLFIRCCGSMFVEPLPCKRPCNHATIRRTAKNGSVKW